LLNSRSSLSLVAWIPDACPCNRTAFLVCLLATNPIRQPERGPNEYC
jgi:hypothetical protein